MTEKIKTMIRELQYKSQMLSMLKTDIRKSSFPKIVVLQTINRCNCACMMCPYSYTVAKEKETRMPEETFNNLINQLEGEEEFESLIFAFQNEPLLDDRIISWAKKFKDKMPNKKLELVSNGSMLGPELAKEVFKYFDLVHISLNAFSAESHEKISGTKHYKKIYDNLIEVAKNPEQQEKTIVRFICQKANLKEKGKFYDFWRKKGFMVFGFDVNDRLKGVKDFNNKVKLPFNTYKKIKMFAMKHLGKIILPTCPIPFICLYIKADGGIVQCFNDWSNKNILDNINDKKIRDIFHSDKYKEIRKKLLEDKLDDNVICEKCDLYREGIWLTA